MIDLDNPVTARMTTSEGQWYVSATDLINDLKNLEAVYVVDALDSQDDYDKGLANGIALVREAIEKVME